MSKRILVVLGATNSIDGKLSNTAIERVNTCAKLVTIGDLILCTGGWGDHFNLSKNPHAMYAKEYLLKKGILNTSFLPFALSNNTVEDAVKIKEIIASTSYQSLVIITSNFHLERVQLIFNEILKKVVVNYIGVKNKMSKKELEKAIEHEKNAIKRIKNNGLFY